MKENCNHRHYLLLTPDELKASSESFDAKFAQARKSRRKTFPDKLKIILQRSFSTICQQSFCSACSVNALKGIQINFESILRMKKGFITLEIELRVVHPFFSALSHLLLCVVWCSYIDNNFHRTLNNGIRKERCWFQGWVLVFLEVKRWSSKVDVRRTFYHLAQMKHFKSSEKIEKL